MLSVANKHSFGNYYEIWLSNAIRHWLFTPCLSIWNTHKIIMLCYSLRPPETYHLSIKSKALSGPSTPLHDLDLISISNFSPSTASLIHSTSAMLTFVSASTEFKRITSFRTFSAQFSCHSLPPGLNKDVFFSIFKFNSDSTSSRSTLAFSSSSCWFAHPFIVFFF